MTREVAIRNLEMIRIAFVNPATKEQRKLIDDTIDMAISALSENKGKWLEKEMFDGDIAYECSECGELFCLITGTPTDNLYNFCPNCGADMRAESEVKPNE